MSRSERPLYPLIRKQIRIYFSKPHRYGNFNLTLYIICFEHITPDTHTHLLVIISDTHARHWWEVNYYSYNFELTCNSKIHTIKQQTKERKTTDRGIQCSACSLSFYKLRTRVESNSLAVDNCKSRYMTAECWFILYKSS